jgi:hypothetical protein
MLNLQMNPARARCSAPVFLSRATFYHLFTVVAPVGGDDERDDQQDQRNHLRHIVVASVLTFYLTVTIPFKRISAAELPIMMRNSPGSTTGFRF